MVPEKPRNSGTSKKITRSVATSLTVAGGKPLLWPGFGWGQALAGCFSWMDGFIYCFFFFRLGVGDCCLKKHVLELWLLKQKAMKKESPNREGTQSWKQFDTQDGTDEPPPAGAGNVNIAFLIFKGNCGVPYFAKEHYFFGAFFPKNHETKSVFQHDRPSFHHYTTIRPAKSFQSMISMRLCTWGCAILYMPRGWMHGGLLLASIAVPLIGFMSIWCALLLLKVPWLIAFDTRFCHRNTLMVSFQVPRSMGLLLWIFSGHSTLAG